MMPHLCPPDADDTPPPPLLPEPTLHARCIEGLPYAFSQRVGDSPPVWLPSPTSVKLVAPGLLRPRDLGLTINWLMLGMAGDMSEKPEKTSSVSIPSARQGNEVGSMRECGNSNAQP